MGIYQSIKDFGKKALVVGGLVAVLSGCGEATRVSENQVLYDVNRDGKKDIVNYKYERTGWGGGSWDMYVALNSDGSFAEPRKVFHLENEPTELRVEDLDGDQIPDLFYVMYESTGWGGGIWNMYSAKGHGDGTFQNPVKIRQDITNRLQ